MRDVCYSSPLLVMCVLRVVCVSFVCSFCVVSGCVCVRVWVFACDECDVKCVVCVWLCLFSVCGVLSGMCV